MAEAIVGSDVQIEQPATSETLQIAHDAGIIAAGSVAGRLFGLGREVVKSHYFGAGGAADALTIAIRVPILLYDLFVGGMISSSLVPVFVKQLEAGRQRLWELLSIVTTLGTVLFAISSLVLMLLASPVAGFMTAGATDSALAQTTALLRLTAPATLFLSVSGVFMGALYALKRFAFPAFAAAVLNAGIVTGTLLLHGQLGPASMAAGLLLGAVLQLALQRLGLGDAPLRWRLELAHPDLRRLGVLYAPIFVGLLVEVLLSRPLTYRLASLSGTGGISRMEYALTLSHFPRGLVALGVSVAVLPLLAAHAGRERLGSEPARAQFRSTLARGIRLILVLILPASAGLLVLARPVVALLLEHGSFTTEDALVTSRALQLYLLALPVAAVDGLLVYAFFARQDTLTPTLVGLGSVTVYLGLAFVLQPHLSLYSLMVADGVKLFIHLSLLVALLAGRLGGLGNYGAISAFLRAMLASALMGAVIWLVLSAMPDRGTSGSTLDELLRILVPATIGLVVYLLAATAAGLGEVTMLWKEGISTATRMWRHD
jgi:putative peptidoglycan lipid II flippase